MRSSLLVLIVVSTAGFPGEAYSADSFIRADANADGVADLADALFMFQHLFAGGSAPSCMKSSDANDDGRSGLSDAIYTLAYLFAGGPIPGPPFPACGGDPTADTLSCDVYPPCSVPATSEPRTAIAGYGSASEPDQSRLHAWITARFDPHAVILDLRNSNRVSFQGLTHVIYAGASSASLHHRVRSKLQAWLVEAPDRWLVWVGPGGEGFDFTEWGFQVSAGARTVGPEVLRYRGKGTSVLEFALPYDEKTCAAVMDPSRATKEGTWDTGSDNGLLVTGVRGHAAGRVLYAGFRVAGRCITRGGAHLPFLDLLHGIYPGRANDAKRMAVRLEDVSALCDFDDPPAGRGIMTAARFLAGEGIPFSLALIPVHLEYDPLVEKHISPRAVSLAGVEEPYDPRFRQNVLDTMNLSPESVVVLHGFSHQYGKGMTGSDAEFCVYEGTPPACSEYVDITYARDRVDLALQEVVEAGLTDPELVGTDRVFGWETPHYQASPQVRREVFERAFTFFFEPAWWEEDTPVLAPEGMTFHLLPYVVSRSQATFLNTYHEYVGLGREIEDGARIVAEAAVLSSLRYEVESAFFFHAHLIEVTYLERIIENLKVQGWEFPPLRTFLPAERELPISAAASGEVGDRSW